MTGTLISRGPFWAETASAKGDGTWPFWIVRNAHCNVLGKLMSRDEAERRAAEMNEERR